MDKRLILLAILVMVAGCDKLDFQFNKQPIYVNITPPPQTIIENGTITPLFPVFPDITNLTSPVYFIGEDSVVVIYNNKAIVIDAGQFTPITVLNNYPNLSVDGVIVTLDDIEKTARVKNIMFTYKPKVIWDNGIISSERANYLMYADELGVANQVVNTDRIVAMGGLDIEFKVPFEGGFLQDKNQNSISVKIGNLLYMSNCYGLCDGMVNLKAEHIVLANDGHCPTNSFDFVQFAGAKKIYGKELCPDFLKDAYLDNLQQLKTLGIEFVQIDNIVVVHDE